MRRIFCAFISCILVMMNLTVFAAAANEKKEPFPHAIAYSKAEDIGLGKSVQGIEVIEYETGRVIVDTKVGDVYNPEGKEVMLMAVFTALTQINSDSIIVQQAALTDEKNNTLGLKPEMEIAVSDAVAAALLNGDVNAVNTLALAASATMESFVEKMNTTARSMGMSHSIYKNATGKYDKNQITTVSDMAILTLFCYKNQIITDITSSETYFIKTDEILNNIRNVENTFELVKSTSEYFNQSIFGVGSFKNSKGVSTSLVTFITSKQKYIIAVRSDNKNCYKELVDVIDYVKKNYALIDIQKIIFELGEKTTVDIGGEKIYFNAMKNTVSNVNVVVNLFYSKSVSKLNDAYSLQPPEELPESVKVGDVIRNFKVLYNGNEISTISLSVKSIGEVKEKETTLGFTLYQPSDVKLEKGSFMEEHSWLIIVAVVLVIGAVLVIGVNNLKNI